MSDATIHHIDPISSGCGCPPPYCEGHPAPKVTDRRGTYLAAVDLIAGSDHDPGGSLAELLAACADLTIPHGHPSRPDPRATVSRLLSAADTLATALLAVRDGEDQGTEATP